jgi:hypothetical protein
VLFKGLLRGKGIGAGAVLFAAAAQVTATEKAARTIKLFITNTFKAERYDRLHKTHVTGRSLETPAAGSLSVSAEYDHRRRFRRSITAELGLL